ncbi:MAG TPA: hypothetical protein VKG79_13740 [Bryobacteraceae bacterium]|nr:hypothetical protein [Bryobacteraceae bacterium]
MRTLLATFLFPAALCAQSTSVSSTTQVDINGHRIPDGPDVVTTKTADGSQTTFKTQSINGRTVPLERIEEKVIRDDASGRVVERTIRRYDPQGNPTPPERQTIEEEKHPDGSSRTVATTYRGNINGGMQLAEKAITESSKSGPEERSETVIQKPTVNGSLDAVEKQSTVKVTGSDGFREESTTYRPGGNGGFYAAVRSVTEHTQQGSEGQDNTVEYEADPSTPLHVHSQTVAKTVTAPDGSKETVLNIYGTNVPGTVDQPGAPLKLKEQQLIQSQKGPNDSVTETLSVRRPTVNDPNTLGPAKQLSQTVCTGACKP